MIQNLLNFFRSLPPTDSFSIQGRKTKQEDSFFISEEKNKQRLIFVADGVGGHGNGEFASKTCVDTYEELFAQNEIITNIPEFLKNTAYLVAAKILNKSAIDSSFKNCGTTISGFFISENIFYTINIGDSRCYRFANNELQKITKDHSYIQQFIDNKEITEEEAFTHPKRNMMTSALGQPLEVMIVDVSEPTPLHKGEMLLAFSDGVHDALKDQEIELLIKQNRKAKNLAQIIVETAFAAGGKDNITACIFRYL